LVVGKEAVMLAGGHRLRSSRERRATHVEVIKLSRMLAVAVGALVLLGTAAAQADLWDLSADWSNAANPNGPWSYRINGAVAPGPGTRGADSFGPPGAPPIWGDNGSYFGWSQDNGSGSGISSVPAGELLLGDVYGHTAGMLEIRWTSPIAGPIHVSGGAWAIRDIGRSNDWAVTLDGVTQVSGSVGSGDAFNRANPNSFDLDLNVAVGQFVSFLALPVDPDYIAVDLTISSNPVPLPGAVLLGALGLSVAGWRLRRRTT